MKKIFEEFGGVIITVVVVVALVAMVSAFSRPGGLLDEAFNNLISSFVEHSE